MLEAELPTPPVHNNGDGSTEFDGNGAALEPGGGDSRNFAVGGAAGRPVDGVSLVDSLRRLGGGGVLRAAMEQLGGAVPGSVSGAATTGGLRKGSPIPGAIARPPHYVTIARTIPGRVCGITYRREVKIS